MMNPRYREVKSSQIPEVRTDDGATIRIICGEVMGERGPVRDVVIEPEYLDFAVRAGSKVVHSTKPGHTVFAYVTEGKAYFSEEKDPFTFEMQGASYFETQRDPYVTNGSLVLFGDSGQVAVSTEDDPVRFLLISGRPIGEPVAWSGPIVMNTQEELRIAFEEYRQGTFIKHRD